MNTTRIQLVSLIAVAAFLGTAENVSAQGTILTFDDVPLAPGPNIGIISNGYGGLQWSDLLAIDGLNFGTPSGYSNAVVSPNNVAYGVAGAISIVSGPSFDLASAYLTGAWNDGLQVQVRGFFKGSLIYDNTYTVVTTQPTFVVFNYLGVDEVRFDASGGVAHWTYPASMFAIDNLSVTLVPEPSCFGVIILGVMMLMWTHREALRVRRSA